MADRLFLSFWDLCLDNLPQGRSACAVPGIGATEQRRPEELCSLLHAKYNCPVRFDDFLSTFDDDRSDVVSITPLQLAELEPGDSLLIVTCNYHIADNTGSSSDPQDRFVVAEDSVAFNLISALFSQETATS